MRLFVGDDWAEDHHDVEVMDATGRVLASRRLPEGVAGMARLEGRVVFYWLPGGFPGRLLDECVLALGSLATSARGGGGQR